MSDRISSIAGQNSGQENADREALRAEANRKELAERIAQALPEDGTAQPIDGLHLHRSSSTDKEIPGVSDPAFCVIAQGSKEIRLGEEDHYRYDPYHYLLATVEAPVVGRHLEASRKQPYLSLRLELDPKLVSSVMIEAGYSPTRGRGSVRAFDVSPLSADLLGATVRLARLLEASEESPVLKPLITREIAFRLLQGEQSRRLRQIVAPDGTDRRITRAINRLHEDFNQSIKIERLAEEVGMSESSFYQHFKAVTGMTPLQFQKQLRLQEARRLMISEDINVSTAGYRVGYNDVPQFSREYKRFFGAPPKRDVERLKETETTPIE